METQKKKEKEEIGIGVMIGETIDRNSKEYVRKKGRI